MEMEEEEITEEQRLRAEANRLAALAKRKAVAGSSINPQQYPHGHWTLFKCRKLSPATTIAKQAKPFDNVAGARAPSGEAVAEKFMVRLEICSPDSFSATPLPLLGFTYPGEDESMRRLVDCLAGVMPSHFTQNLAGGKACVYKLRDYDAVIRCLKSFKSIVIEEIPWGTFNVIEKLSHSFIVGQWIPCRPEHLPDEKVDELIGKLPRKILDTLLPFQVDGVKFGLRRGGRCLIADEMGLGKTLQAIAIASCFLDEGSILIVCPAILRFSWAEELERWFPCLPTDIHLVFGHLNNPSHLQKWPKIVVISYKMLHHLRRSMLDQEWSLLIVDESHHIRSSKKSAEPEEIKSVLDVAAKVRRIILLSGTPSLSRPYDIFHQINMLWPGLLGKDKFDFARTYCDVKFDQGYQGKVFKDYSKGIRLEELNILLRQTVMIRRLKEHVLVHLPPKRRQILRILLKKSDIISAKAAVRVVDGDALDDITLGNTDQSDDSNGRDRLRNLSYQEVGIAKLSGFREWLSLHPLIAASDEVVDSPNCHKMIVFAHHHRVLDGVQDIICEKGIGFTRIDGNTLPRDRQSAVMSFQSSNQVKIAIIGITAGGVGLNLSSAKTVVFLELPPSPSWMLQAEDRAHRQGQTNAVNIYYFCAKDTTDDLHWQYLRKSLYRVSSTTNGKRDAILDIAVDNVSYFGICDKTDRSYIQMLEEIACSQLSQKEDPTKTEEDDGKPAPADPVKADENCSNIKKSPLVEESALTTRVGNGECADVVEIDQNIVNFINSLRFEVSQYTGRIHLYTCTPGTDSRPRPLFHSFRPEDVNLQSALSPDNKFLENSRGYIHGLLTFINQWNTLRPIQRRKLLGKPLQLPLAIELCYLKEGINHDGLGLLKGKSRRRTTPLFEISHPLPENAVWKKVHLVGSYCKKDKEYTQGWTMMDGPLCKLCQSPCVGENAKRPEYFEDLFCNSGCYEEYRLRTSAGFLRQELFRIERGVCTNCQIDCHQLVKCLKPLSVENRRYYIKRQAPNLASRKKLVDKLVNAPTEGNAWHADHIVPVFRGGGECRLENMRTLCVACHFDVTAAQRAERHASRVEGKRRLKEILSGLKNDCNMGQTEAKSKWIQQQNCSLCTMYCFSTRFNDDKHMKAAET
ncbi:DNA annealing helicase and endonuclease ZRANB3 isoform X3 [Rhodamnia argentea]|uniref:DNA annealing helicase and endonuclease ZRANB3 isoform X3 n=1 Tax=Rhodamnia argentea TaxID=178133 RepID=A0A8B8PAP5_9MYRT|nr:DNA annealing helicase and endonuclease ZRANB3 isoform X3 [Rhodamnia argentea]